MKLLHRSSISLFSCFQHKFQLCCKLSGTAASPSFDIPSLITPELAIDLHRRKDIKFIDGSWYLNDPKLAYNDFKEERIPDSQFFDIEEICDKTSDLPHMLPDENTFSEYVSNLGISSEDQVVIFAKKNSISSARVWWTFRAFGHEKVSIIDGGFNGWKEAGGEIESGEVISVKRGNFTSKLNKKLVVNWEEVLEVVKSGSKQILDARSKARFLAEAPEPRAGLPRGHIPGSLSLPFTSLVDTNDMTKFKSKVEIRDAFIESGAVLQSDFIFTCGSGVTAAVLNFGMHLIGKDLEKTAIYDGSWSEWGARTDLPKLP